LEALVLTYLLDAFSGPGAAFMYAITALLALALAITVERSWLLWFRWRVDSNAVVALIAQGQLSPAATAASGTPLGEVLAAGAGERQHDLAWDAMSTAGLRAEGHIRRRIDALATVSNLATMLGLLGTVYGLILAFSGLGDTASAERAARLSEGISTAMATTAYGLLVGIPALGLHAWLDARARLLLEDIEVAAGHLTLSLKRASSPGPDTS
jgi:biopolymer transport protein ExbB